ncbi:SH3 domain-containing protein [Streptomyces sp. NPDC046876]|uniref:SH3 domain-containing protein n=1 Tax=Streptomyces sp. NPDC046876 TaxID=3155616 RepID=UPI0033CB92EA
MQKPARTVLALAAGSLVLGAVGAGSAVADDGRTENSSQVVLVEPKGDGPGKYDDKDYTVGKVVARGSLKVRSRPSTNAPVVGLLQSEQKVAILCKIRGEKVDGNDIWYRLYIKKKHSDSSEDSEESKDHHGRHDQEDTGLTDEDEAADENIDDSADSADSEDSEDWGDEEDSGDPGKRTRARAAKKGDDKEHEKAWVSARYVKNLSTVIWCP